MHPIENMMKTTMEEIKEMIDVNTIVGDAVHTAEGAVIIPISKVSFGFVAGGGEYGEGGSSRKEDEDFTDNPFAGGGSAGISLNPMAFLVVNENNIRLMPVHYNNTIDRLIEMIPQAINTMKSKKKDDTANSASKNDMGTENTSAQYELKQDAAKNMSASMSGQEVTADDGGAASTGTFKLDN